MGVGMAWGLLPQVASGKDLSNQQKVELLQYRTPGDIVPLIEVTGDSLDPMIQVSSYGAEKISTHSILFGTSDVRVNDGFLRAYINRKDGTVISQIYHIDNYGSTNGWRFYDSSSFSINGDLKEVDTTSPARNFKGCGSQACAYEEHIIIPISFSDLEKVASSYNLSAGSSYLSYRIFAQSGYKLDGRIPINEVVAFVDVVHNQQKNDMYRYHVATAPMGQPAPGSASARH